MAEMEEKINVNSRPPQAVRKKILFVITQSELGGAQRFLIQLVNNLPRDRFECVVAAGMDGGEGLKAALPADVPYITVQSLYREPDLADDVRSLFELRKLYQEIRPDIIFLNSSKAGFNGSWAASALPGRLPGITVIYRIGGWSFNDPRPAIQRILIKVVEKISDSWKDYIIVNNSGDLEDAKRIRILPRKELLLIHNGIDPYMSFAEKDEARRQIREQLQADPFAAPYTLGVIANYYPSKGLPVLAEALAQIKSNANCIIIGGGNMKNELEEIIKSKSLANRVFMTGPLQNAGQLVKAFDTLILPSLKEGFPWTVLEAMAAKVPVIATRVGSVPEIIEDYKNGISVDPGKPADLAQAIDKMLSDENLRMQCAIEAHQTLIHRFSLTKMVNAYIELFSRS